MHRICPKSAYTFRSDALAGQLDAEEIAGTASSSLPPPVELWPLMIPLGLFVLLFLYLWL